MYTAGKSKSKILLIKFVAMILFVATFCVEKNVYADSFDDITWKEKAYVMTDDTGREIKYILRDKKVRVYVDDVRIWQSDEKYFVQDMLVADIDEDTDNRSNPRINKKTKEELVLLLWKEGRYGAHRPFWVKEDEKDYSQHIFTYNVDGEKVVAKWGSSYMGEEASFFMFKDGILFLTHKGNKESAWKWYSFGFEKLEPAKIFVAGDNLIHDVIYLDAIKNHNNDFEYIYKKVEKYTKEADLSIINLETPLVYDEKKYSTYPCFGSPVSVAKGLKDAGFDVVTLSTNHRLDKGVTGINDTLQAVSENDLMHVGSMDEKPYLLVKRNEIIFALMNYTYGTNGIRPPKGYENAVNYLDDEERIREEIREAKEVSDIVIVFPHWGTEYKMEPDSYEKRYRDLFYEEGVDIVVGTHPHVYQKVEKYKIDGNNHEMLIYYSLGNYISGNQRKDHNKGMIGTIEVGMTSMGPSVIDYKYQIIDTMYNDSKYLGE